MKMCAYNWKMHPPRNKNKNKIGVESQSTICWKRKINDKKSNHNTINHNSYHVQNPVLRFGLTPKPSQGDTL